MNNLYRALVIVFLLSSISVNGQNKEYQYSGFLLQNDSTIVLDSVIDFMIGENIQHMDDIVVLEDKNVLTQISHVRIESDSSDFAAFWISSDSTSIIKYSKFNQEKSQQDTIRNESTEVIICELDMAGTANELSLDSCMKNMIKYSIGYDKEIDLFFAFFQNGQLYNMTLEFK
ncbi:hypothetical protein JKA74_13945 [Marivirga sp. S37H4]|uniref:Uncharacterized protein n=1 Tax=Marivirga aurantiaca TaxID=2802615 RepID=A0A935CAD9_9BACT|nr:hypothetical protein [Marivirga aurantiaca]MBK6266142.1 hypothetical protein [Marivirga aurantiaca]